MPLVFAGITTHSPLLVPEVGKDKQKVVDCSKKAIDELAEDLYVSRPEILIVISPYAGVFENTFSINAHNTLTSDFSDFGDLTTRESWSGAPTFAAIIERHARKQNIRIRSVSDDNIDHGISIPLMTLAHELKNTKILPIGFSELDQTQHLKFGELLKEVIMESNKRVAILVSGHLSHTLTAESPDGFHASGLEFDEMLVKHLESCNSTAIVQMDNDVVENSKQSIYKSILILLGIIRGNNFQFETYCYEAPLGVGYLTGTFHL